VSFLPRDSKPEPSPGPSPTPLPKPAPKPPPAPQTCLDNWNTYEKVAPNPNLGIHFYADPHGVRRAWVYLFTDSAGEQRCAAVMVVPETDLEYGADGELSGPGPSSSWSVMSGVAGFRPFEAQGAAAANANASLDQAGNLSAL
jgi:hypothetical protein